MTTTDAPPLVCIRCGDPAGPWALTPDGPVCEDCETAAKTTDDQ